MGIRNLIKFINTEEKTKKFFANEQLNPEPELFSCNTLVLILVSDSVVLPENPQRVKNATVMK